METAQPTPAEKEAAAAFFRNVHRILDYDDLKAQTLRLEQEIALLSAKWREERDARREAERRLEAATAKRNGEAIKGAIVRLLQKLPPSWWPSAGRIVRRIWPGFVGA